MGTTYSDEVIAWAEFHARCMICHLPHWRAEREQITGLQKMHIIRRSIRRCDSVENLLLGCSRCHEAEHRRMPYWPALSLPHLLYAKLTSDGANWNPDALEELYRRRLPQPMPLPQKYLDERELHRRYA